MTRNTTMTTPFAARIGAHRTRSIAAILALGACAAVASALNSSSIQGAPAPAPATPAAARTGGGTGGIPARPEKLAYPPLTFEAPRAADYRRTLSDGTVVYMAPNKEFPLISLAVTCMGGANLDPADRVGLASMTGSILS